MFEVVGELRAVVWRSVAVIRGSIECNRAVTCHTELLRVRHDTQPPLSCNSPSPVNKSIPLKRKDIEVNVSLILQREKCGFMFYFCFSHETEGNDR